MTQPNYAATDANDKPSLTAVSSSDSTQIVRLTADPATGALLVTNSGSGATATWKKVNGTIDGSNVTFTVTSASTSDFLLVLARQPQAQDIGADIFDYSYVAAAGTITITYHTAPDASLSGFPHQALCVT